jgi:AraC-like DNA-binding protein
MTKSLLIVQSAISHMQTELVRTRNLLTQTAQSVKEIAQKAGFEDEHYFCRLFKMKTGLAPGQWRAPLNT